MYYGGEGVPQDYKKALHWFTKAAEQGDATSEYNREILLKQMTSSQIEEGQKLSKEL
jgi:TPR repeat protein